MSLVSLANIDSNDECHFGGKAIGLAKLCRNGFQIPNGFVLPVQAMVDFLNFNAHKPEDSAIECIRNGVFPDSLANDIDDVCRRLGPFVAVRSSGVNEDGVSSFAGQYETVLKVPANKAVFNAIRKCWASYFSTHAIAYRRDNNMDDEGLAVIIQTMLFPIRSGVLFGINPISGSWQEMVVESHPGLGEQVVGGRVIPDSYRVRRPRRLPPPLRRFAARFRLRSIETLQRTHSPLLEKDLIALCRMGLKAERRFGSPQDLEWAQTADGRIWVLQSRPITVVGQSEVPLRAIWTRQFMGERWSVPATELGWTEMAALMNYFIDYPNVRARFLDGEPTLKLHLRSPYVNTAIFRHLIFKLPGREPTPRFMLELLPPNEADGWRRKYAGMPNFSLYAALLLTTLKEKRWRRFSWNPFRNARNWDEYVLDLNVFLKEMQRPIQGREEALSRLNDCREMARKYLGIHVCSLLFANLWVQIMRWRLTELGYAEDIKTLLRPEKSTPTQEMNEALRLLGQNKMSLNQFMNRYGNRAANSWSLFSNRFFEEPQQVLALAESAAVAPQHEPNDYAEAAVGLNKKMLWMLKHTQKMLFLREEQRFHFDRLLMRWRQTWFWLEKDTGVELRHLDLNAALKVIQAKESPNTEVLFNNKRAWQVAGERWSKGDYPPSFLSPSKILLGSESKSWRGVGISPGVVFGPVRLIYSIEQLKDCHSGDILVANTIEPGWTSVFLRVAGVALDLGGMLSHGAIVAREYGVPGVAGLGDFTNQVKNGQRIGLDGATGRVWLVV